MASSVPDMGGTSIELREVRKADLDVFFAHMQDAEALWMAAFTPPDPTDREAFDAHWDRLLDNPDITTRTILNNGEVVGSVTGFEMFGDREVTYWLDRAAWGSGVATAALRQFLSIEETRPLFGRVAADNVASRRVLEKCGFVKVGDDRGFASARDEEIDELILRLD